MQALNLRGIFLPLLALAILAVTTKSVMGQSSYPFVDPDFDVPEILETEEFRLRMLTVNDVVKSGRNPGGRKV